MLSILFLASIWASNTISKNIFIALIDNIESATILSIFNYLTVVLFFSISINVYHLIKNRKKFKFGVYWDNEKNTYCPICKKPVTRFIKNTKRPYLYCSHCDTEILLTHKGKVLHLDLASDLIDNQRIDSEEVNNAKKRIFDTF